VPIGRPFGGRPERGFGIFTVKNVPEWEDGSSGRAFILGGPPPFGARARAHVAIRGGARRPL